MFDKNENVLITVKAYPNPSKKYQETVCVAGIVLNKGLIRLYPIKYRSLPEDKKFKKYDIVNVDIVKHNDGRPESYRPVLEKFKKVRNISTKYDKSWSERKSIVLEFADESMCDIQRKQQEYGKSLGLFKPKEIHDLIITKDNNRNLESKKSLYSQMSMFGKTLKPLDDIPYSFKFKYSCYHSNCKGHVQSLIDWEVFELYRNIKKKYGNAIDTIKEKIKQKYLDEILSEKKDFYFFAGNQFLHPKSFILLGVFWPPKHTGIQLSLDEL